MAEWLHVTFSVIPRSAFSCLNTLSLSLGKVLTPFSKFISLFGNHGLFFILLGVVLLLFKRTRRVGVTVLLSLLVGFIFTNLLIKPMVMRTRPYENGYYDFWQVAGGVIEKDKSFPSGHVTSCTASMVAVFLNTNKKYSWTAFIFVLLMAFARVYLIVHYLTDVVCGFIIGGLSAIAMQFVARLIYNWIYKNENKPFFKFVLNADVLNLIKKKEK